VKQGFPVNQFRHSLASGNPAFFDLLKFSGTPAFAGVTKWLEAVSA
jgi:hypothetical protein